jgi:hypothetical protein
VEVARPAFFILIFDGRYGMDAQVISKGEVTFGVRRICLEKMKMNNGCAVFISQSAKTSSFYAKLAVPSVTERLFLLPFSFKFSQIGDQTH